MRAGCSGEGSGKGRLALRSMGRAGPLCGRGHSHPRRSCGSSPRATLWYLVATIVVCLSADGGENHFWWVRIPVLLLIGIPPMAALACFKLFPRTAKVGGCLAHVA